MRTVVARFEDVIPAKSEIDSPALSVPEPFFPRFVRWKGEGKAPFDVAFLDIVIDGYGMFAQVRGIDRPKGLSLATFDQVEPGQPGFSIEWSRMNPDSDVMFRFVNHGDQDVRVVLEIEGFPMKQDDCPPLSLSGIQRRTPSLRPYQIDAYLKRFKEFPNKFKATDDPVIVDEAHRIPVENVRLRVVPDLTPEELPTNEKRLRDWEEKVNKAEATMREAKDEPHLRLVDIPTDEKKALDAFEEFSTDGYGDEYD